MKYTFLRKGKLEEKSRKRKSRWGVVLFYVFTVNSSYNPAAPSAPSKGSAFQSFGLSNVGSRNAEAWTEWNVNVLRGSLQSHRESLSKFIVLI